MVSRLDDCTFPKRIFKLANMLLFKSVHLQMVDSPWLIGNVSRLSVNHLTFTFDWNPFYICGKTKRNPPNISIRSRCRSNASGSIPSQGRFLNSCVFSPIFFQGSSSFPIFKRLPPIQPPKTTKTKNPPEANQTPRNSGGLPTSQPWPTNWTFSTRHFVCWKSYWPYAICRSAFGREIKYPMAWKYAIFMLDCFPVLWDILI